MKKMKKQAVSLLLVLAMVLATVTGCGNNSGVSSDNSKNTTKDKKTEDTNKKETTTKVTNRTPAGKLVIGQNTDLTGDFMTGWTNGAADMDVRRLTQEYGTVVRTRDGSMQLNNTVVKKLDTKENSDKSKTFTYTINKGLKYSDGTEITAKDFVFYLLLNSCKAFGDSEADITMYTVFDGYNDFSTGKKKEFKGVRLLGDDQFSVTISAKELPDYYDMARTAASPYPISVYLPGVDVKDDGNGAYFTKDVTKAMIKKTIEKERYNPTIFSGAYTIKDYNKSAGTVTLEANTNYAGNYEGQKAQIKTLVIKKYNDDTAIDELKTGNVDLLISAGGGDVVNAGLDLADKGEYKYNNYYRNGFGKVVFTCDLGPTQFVKVRQAIAYLLDRTEFASQYTGGYGTVVNSNYGLAQWMYTDMKDKVDKELNTYAYNVDKAKELLVSDGWTLNKDGKEFKEGKDDVRYKKVDGKLMPLEIQWANTANNPVSDLLSTMLPDNMKKVGMKLKPTTLDWGVLTNNVLRQGIDKPVYNMYNMASEYGDIPSYEMEANPDKAYGGLYNENWINDKELFQLAKDLKATESTDREGYDAKWLKYIKRWNELLPSLPLYSNEFYDFYNKKLQNYSATSVYSYSYDIIYSYVK
ncbi:oligopeptide ABC transporter, periplasmic oligopeptide-binding protein OppA [Lachnospiraceae bacterium KM106-2]|nr:oligopeptide ABC transporter, periplasmic oligopeptide-binding protein OppA [Lachnospiraceae bacterium KM106-2]